MTLAQVGIDQEAWSLPRATAWEQPVARRGAWWTLAGLILVLMDFVLVSGLFMLSYMARFSLDDTAPSLALEQYIRLSSMVGVLTVVLLATHGIYDLERPQSWPVRLRSVVSSSATGLVLTVAASYFIGDQTASRLWLTTGWVTSVIALVVWRTVVRHAYARVRASLASTNRVLIVGANRVGQELADELKAHYEVVGYVDNGSDLERLELPLLGPIAQIEEVVEAYAVDELIVALPSSRREQLNRSLARGFPRHVRVKLLQDQTDMLPTRWQLHAFGGRHYIGFISVPPVSWAKRAVDVVIVGSALLVLSPVLLAIVLAIKLDSPGPVLYRQLRVGKQGRSFWMYKFRSMCQDAERRLEALRAQNEATGPLFKMRQDPRVTKVGRLLAVESTSFRSYSTSCTEK